MDDVRAALDKVAGRPKLKPEPPAASPASPADPASPAGSVPERHASGRVGPDQYERLLWGTDHMRSGTLDYVRAHANRMVRRVDAEDARALYAPQRHVQDVHVFKRVASAGSGASPGTGAGPGSARFSPASSFSSSFSSARVRAPSSSVDALEAREEEEQRLPGQFEFRAATRVPGALETVMAALAPETPRDAYWLAANTQRNLRFTALTHAARVAGPQSPPAAVQDPAAAAHDPAAGSPFPRWSLQYLMTKFIKHSRTMDVAFSEFAAMDPPPTAAPPSNKPPRRRRGFVYRRSVDDRALGDAALQRKLAAVAAVGTDASVAARAHERVDRFFLQDWLLDVREADEAGSCKIVLTARALFRADDELLRRSMRLEFREFSTNFLLAARKLLVAQWAELTAARGPAGLPSAPKTCAVCSSAFSLLRKRHACKSCAACVCSKCLAPKLPHVVGSVSSAGLLGEGTGGPAASANARKQRECVLCAHFGPDPDSRAARASQSQRSTVSLGVRRAFDAAVSLSVTSAPASDDEDEDGDGGDAAAPALFSSSFVGASSRGGTVLLDEPGHGTPSTASTASSSVSPPPRRQQKFRTDSSDSTSSARSAPGVVLISEIETLSLTGGFRRIPSSGASSNGSFGSSVGPRARSNSRLKRPDRAVSEDNVLASLGTPAKAAWQPQRPVAPKEEDDDDDEEEDVAAYSEDDLANFTLELAP